MHYTEGSVRNHIAIALSFNRRLHLWSCSWASLGVSQKESALISHLILPEAPDWRGSKTKCTIYLSNAVHTKLKHFKRQRSTAHHNFRQRTHAGDCRRLIVSYLTLHSTECRITCGRLRTDGNILKSFWKSWKREWRERSQFFRRVRIRKWWMRFGTPELSILCWQPIWRSLFRYWVRTSSRKSGGLWTFNAKRCNRIRRDITIPLRFVVTPENSSGDVWGRRLSHSRGKRNSVGRRRVFRFPSLTANIPRSTEWREGHTTSCGLWTLESTTAKQFICLQYETFLAEHLIFEL